MSYLLLSLAIDEIFKKVNSQVITVAEVCLYVNSQEDINLSFRAKLRSECGRGNLLLLWLVSLHARNGTRLKL